MNQVTVITKDGTMAKAMVVRDRFHATRPLPQRTGNAVARSIQRMTVSSREFHALSIHGRSQVPSTALAPSEPGVLAYHVIQDCTDFGLGARQSTGAGK
jgi:hypothetical protein